MASPLKPVLLALGLCAGLWACGPLPTDAASFDSPDPQARLAALRHAMATGDRGAIPEIIPFLDSDDSAARMLANRALIEMTGQDFGYDYAAPEWQRRQGAERWHTWWAGARQGEAGPAPGGGLGSP